MPGVMNRRARWLAGAAVLLVAVVALTLALAARTRRPSPTPTLELRPLTIAPGIHMLGGLAPSVAYAVETRRGIVLIDSGLEADAGPLKAQMAELGLDWRNIHAILLTHAHGDHCGGAAHLRSQTGARVHAGAGDAEVIRTGGPREAVFSHFDMPGHATHGTPVDVALQDGQELDFGDARIRALVTPGHTPGSTCYWLELGGLRVLFGGDVFSMLRGDEANDDPFGPHPLGTYAAYLPPRYRGDAAAYLASIRRLRGLPAPDLLLPGHPLADPTPQNPRLAAGRWEEILDAGAREMEALLARRQADGADFLDGQPRELLGGLYYLGDRDDQAVYALRAAGGGFVLVDAPGGPGLPAFVEAALRGLGVEPGPVVAVLLTSGGPQATSGLAELVQRHGCRVVASRDGIGPSLAVPPGAAVLPADELSAQGWIDAEPLPLRGRGLFPIAYRVRIDGKTALFSGRFPIRPKDRTIAALLADLAAPGGDALDYLRSIMALRVPAPDLWLPAVPTEGRDANLSQRDWYRLIDENWDLIESNARRLRPAPARGPAQR